MKWIGGYKEVGPTSPPPPPPTTDDSNLVRNIDQSTLANADDDQTGPQIGATEPKVMTHRVQVEQERGPKILQIPCRCKSSNVIML